MESGKMAPQFNCFFPSQFHTNCCSVYSGSISGAVTMTDKQTKKNEHAHSTQWQTHQICLKVDLA